MSGITFSEDTILAIGLHPKTNAVTRVLCIAAERADRRGLAIFDPGELSELLTDQDGNPMSNRALRSVLRATRCIGHFVGTPTPTRIQLNSERVRSRRAA